MKVQQLIILAPTALAAAHLDLLDDQASIVVDDASGLVGDIATLVTGAGGTAATIISAIGGNTFSTVTGMAGDVAAPLASGVGDIISYLTDASGNIIGTVCEGPNGGMTTISGGAGGSHAATATADFTGPAITAGDYSPTALIITASSADNSMHGLLTDTDASPTGGLLTDTHAPPSGGLITATGAPPAGETMITSGVAGMPGAYGTGSVDGSANASSFMPSNFPETQSGNAAPAAATAGPMAVGGLLGAGVLVLGLL